MSDTKVREVKLVHALLEPNVRSHDVRKDEDWKSANPLDPKYCTFRRLLAKLTTIALQAELISIWIISRSLHLLEAFSNKIPKARWPKDWLQFIKPMSRDLGVNRETAGTVSRAKDCILAIKRMKQPSVSEIEEWINSVDDFGPLKAQHLLWNLHLCGWLQLEDISWDAMKPFISDRATTALVVLITATPQGLADPDVRALGQTCGQRP